MRIFRASVPILVLAAMLAGISLTAPAALAADPLSVAAVTASAHDGNVPQNTIDNSLSTRWSASGDGVWIQYDLGSSKTVGWLSIAWYRGNERRANFDVQTSADATSWTNVISDRDSGGTSTQPENYDFTDRSARYVRIVGHGNEDNAWNSIAEVDIFGAGSPGGGGGPCDYPGQILNLNNWKVQLPVDDPDQSGTQPLEVKPPAVATYRISPWFTTTSSCDRVQFRNAVNGATTPNTTYARSELRELTSSGANASWSSTSGTHTMVINQAITHLPNTKPHVVAGQIHDGNDRSVFRLEGSSLYVTQDNDTHYKLVTSNYVLGTRFEAKFVVSGGNIRAYYNGTLQATIPVEFTTGYFKAGVYTQANCTNSSPCDTSNYGEVMIYSVSVSHS